MKKFVLVGDIEFIDGTAYVRRVAYGVNMNALALDILNGIGKDYVIPHYFKGPIVFDQHRDEETRQFLRDELIEKLDREALEEKIQARRDADY
jgi:hypothetical protein